MFWNGCTHRSGWIAAQSCLLEKNPILPVPVLTRSGNPSELRVRYLRLYIVKGQELRGEPLNAKDIEALDFFDSVMNRPGGAVTIPLERG